jgi:hypothetical protein
LLERWGGGDVEQPAHEHGWRQATRPEESRRKGAARKHSKGKLIGVKLVQLLANHQHPKPLCRLGRRVLVAATDSHFESY